MYSLKEYGDEMALKADILKDRLKEAFGSDSQETVGKKLNMTQGNISKLLSGSQQPTLETMYHIAETYDVSVDWLLGISDKKNADKAAGQITYASAVKAVLELKLNGATVVSGKGAQDVHIQASDVLFVTLLKKALTLRETDRDLYQNWLETKLSLFEDKPLLYYGSWHEDTVEFLTRSANTESNWLKVYDAAKEAEARFAEMMGDDTSPFTE